jgi:hypothetical protein
MHSNIRVGRISGIEIRIERSIDTRLATGHWPERGNG